MAESFEMVRQVLGYHILEVNPVGKEALRKSEQARHLQMRELQTQVRFMCQMFPPSRAIYIALLKKYFKGK